MYLLVVTSIIQSFAKLAEIALPNGNIDSILN